MPSRIRIYSLIQRMILSILSSTLLQMSWQALLFVRFDNKLLVSWWLEFLIALIILVALLQTWCIVRWGAKWMMSMTIGAYCKWNGLSLSHYGYNMYPSFCLRNRDPVWPPFTTWFKRPVYHWISFRRTVGEYLRISEKETDWVKIFASSPVPSSQRTMSFSVD